jgi:hypothetical protein
MESERELARSVLTGQAGAVLVGTGTAEADDNVTLF